MIPPRGTHDAESRQNEWPDVARTSYFLAWFVPMVVFVALFTGGWVRPSLMQNSYVVGCLALLIVLQDIGAFWMVYQAVRYEERQVRYAILAFIPFIFIWYSLVRVPLRKQFQSNSQFIR
jgi:hypothetical protein